RGRYRHPKIDRFIRVRAVRRDRDRVIAGDRARRRGYLHRYFADLTGVQRVDLVGLEIDRPLVRFLRDEGEVADRRRPAVGDEEGDRRLLAGRDAGVKRPAHGTHLEVGHAFQRDFQVSRRLESAGARADTHWIFLRVGADGRINLDAERLGAVFL